MRPKVPIPPKIIISKGSLFPPITAPQTPRLSSPNHTSTVSPTQIIASAHSSRAYPKPNILQYHALSSITNPHTCLSPQDTPTKTHVSRKHNTSLKFHALTYQNTVPYPPHKYPAPNPLQHTGPYGIIHQSPFQYHERPQAR